MESKKKLEKISKILNQILHITLDMESDKTKYAEKFMSDFKKIHILTKKYRSIYNS